MIPVTGIGNYSQANRKIADPKYARRAQTSYGRMSRRNRPIDDFRRAESQLRSLTQNERWSQWPRAPGIVGTDYLASPIGGLTSAIGLVHRYSPCANLS